MCVSACICVRVCISCGTLCDFRIASALVVLQHIILHDVILYFGNSAFLK